jgi:uncharacterized protein YxeA
MKPIIQSMIFIIIVACGAGFAWHLHKVDQNQENAIKREQNYKDSLELKLLEHQTKYYQNVIQCDPCRTMHENVTIRQADTSRR